MPDASRKRPIDGNEIGLDGKGIMLRKSLSKMP